MGKLYYNRNLLNYFLDIKNFSTSLKSLFNSSQTRDLTATSMYSFLVQYMPWRILIVKWFIGIQLVVVFLDQVTILPKTCLSNAIHTHTHYPLSLKSQLLHMAYMNLNLGSVIALDKRR